MKLKKLLSLATFITVVTASCMGSNNNYTTNNNLGTAVSDNSIKKVGVPLNSQVKKSLAYMYEEERLAKEVYLSVYKKQPVRQLYQIATNSETRHINAVKDLARKYGVKVYPQQVGHYKNPHIQELFNRLYAKGIRSQKDALEVGCIVEVTDINDLNKYIAQAQKSGARDVLHTYIFLRRGSYKHYWAFDRGLRNLGVTKGCCSLGDKYCHPEYPLRSKGRGHGRGHGMGHGHGGGHGMGGGFGN
jgi:hypothetical protein